MRRLVLFDVDGTLLDARRAGSRALLASAGEVFGRPFQRQGVPFAGRTDRAILTDLMLVNGVPSSEVDGAIGDVFAALLRHMVAQTADTPSVPCPGVPALLEALRSRPEVTLGLLTGNLRETAAVKLASAGLNPDWFPVGAYGDESSERNELPPLALARASMAAHQAVVVGDTPADIACANANGLRAVAVATGPYSVEELAQHRPDVVLPDLRDTSLALRAVLADNGASTPPPGLRGR